MGNTRNRESWYRVHASALFVALLIVGGFATLFAGLWYGPTNPLANLLLTLSGSLFAGGVAGVFLSFRDVKDQLARIFSTSLSNGTMIDMLSPSARDSFEEQILSARLLDTTSFLEPSLMQHLRSVSTQCLQMAHFHNYNVFQTLRPHSREDLLVSETVMTFCIRAFHLKDETTLFDYKYLHQIPISGVLDLSEKEYLVYFKACLGDIEFTEDSENVKVKTCEHSGIRCMRVEVQKSVLVKGEMICSVKFKLATLKADNVTANFMRYPTYGFHRELIFDNQHDYDCLIFKGRDPSYKEFPGHGEKHRVDNGISISTSDWMLPGEGVMIHWMPKL